MLMDKRITSFLAAARSCALSPVEHAQVRAALVAHTLKTTPSAVLQESSTALQLTDYEKAIGRAKLLSFMRANPVEEQAFSLAHMLFRPFTAALSSAVALTLIGGGMAYAAEGSLPGDLLYPVKVHVTEPIISSLSITSAKRAQWEIRTIERRLEEADALGNRPDQADRQTILHSQMEQDATNLQERLHTLPEKERQTAQQTLHSKFVRHEDSLVQIQSTTGVPPTLKALVKEADEESRDEEDRQPSLAPLPDKGNEKSASSLSRNSDRGEEDTSSFSSRNREKKRRSEQERELIPRIQPIQEPSSSSSSTSSSMSSSSLSASEPEHEDPLFSSSESSSKRSFDEEESNR